MSKLKPLFAILGLVLPAIAESFARTDGLIAEWNFDEGKGDVARDTSGHGHDGKISGATWVKQGDGFAVSLDGLDDYVDCGALGIAGPITIEAWVRPMRKGHGLAAILGGDLHNFLLSYDNAEYCYWYVGDGPNYLRGNLTLKEWNHVAATFDGKWMRLWINGRLANYQESLVKSIEPGWPFVMGTKGYPHLPKFKGMLDKVRMYNRALSAEEVVTHFKGEALGYGFDPIWFSRVKVTPYYYFDRGEVVVEADYRGLQPLNGKGRIEVALFDKQKPENIIQQQTADSLSDAGVVEVKLTFGKLAEGDYVIRVALKDEQAPRPVEEMVFSYPPKPSSVPSPSAKTVAALPAESKPTPFDVKVRSGGGFDLTIRGASYSFESRISWPKGDFNRLTAKDEPYDKGEKSWKVSVRAAGKDSYQMEASGDFYSIQREVQVFPTHVQVKDTYTNTTKEDLGLLIYNETLVKPGQVTGAWLSGYEERGRRTETSDPDWGPNVFFTDANTGIDIIPIDDVYVVQALPYVVEDAAGVATEKFALAPGKSYTLEWAVYPTGSGDYYDFINTFRKVEGRIGTVEGAPGFVTYSPHPPLSHYVPDKDFIEKRNLKIGIIHCLAEIADDPALEVEGFEITDFPKEMQLLKEQVAAIHKKHPGVKVVFHIAHSNYTTDKPEQFADSKVIGPDGKHVMWGDGSAFGKEKQAKGWRWWVFYPTPGNSYHAMMMKRIEVMMDEIGLDGAFMDGFFAGYGSRWTYDRWDEHSAEIDPTSKTITRKVGSVLLLSQPSLIEFARKIRDKGGVVIAENDVITRSIANEKYLIFDYECASGPQLHLSPTVTALAVPGPPALKTDKDIYLDTLDKLSWGELFIPYAEDFQAFAHRSYPSLQARQYPMTFEEIRAGLVKGRERIVTMNPGVYGWPGDYRLHVVYKFDERGAPVRHDFLTTVDSEGVRTDLKLDKQQSAVIELVPAVLRTTTAVNGRVITYDVGGLRVLFYGKGNATLEVESGLFPISDSATYRATIGGKMTRLTQKNGRLNIPLKLAGPAEVVIERKDRTE